MGLPAGAVYPLPHLRPITGGGSLQTMITSATDNLAQSRPVVGHGAVEEAQTKGQPPAVATRPMVLHVRVVTGHGGGPEKTILNSPRFLQRLGYQSKLAYLHPPGDQGFDTLQARGRALGTEVISIPDRGPLDLSVV